MATVTKREWTTSKGAEKQAWVLAYTDAQGKRHKEQFATKGAADVRRKAVEGQIDSGTFRADAKTKTVSDACKEYLGWLEDRNSKDQKATKTYLVTNQGEIWNYIAPDLKPDDHQPSSRVTPFPTSEAIGHHKLAQFTTAHAQDFAERLLAAGMSVTMTKRVIATLSRVLRRAIGKDWIAINVAKGVKILEASKFQIINGRKVKVTSRVIPPSKADVDKLLKASQAAKDSFPDLYTRILFAAVSGLRASEQWALRWRDLDLESCKVFVSERLDYHGQLSGTKTDAGFRTVPLGKSVVAALKLWKQRTKKSGHDDIVFPNSEGGHTRHGNFLKRTFDPFKVAAEVPSVTWHAFRHFAISTWIEVDLKPKVVQTYAGHATLAITMDRYGHLFPSDDHSTAMDKVADSIALKDTMAHDGA